MVLLPTFVRLQEAVLSSRGITVIKRCSLRNMISDRQKTAEQQQESSTCYTPPRHPLQQVGEREVGKVGGVRVRLGENTQRERERVEERYYIVFC